MFFFDKQPTFPVSPAPPEEPLSGAEIECAVQGFMRLPSQEQETALRALIHIAMANRPQENLPNPQKIPEHVGVASIPTHSVPSLPAEDFRLREKAERELELFPLKHCIGIARDGSYVLQIDVPKKVGKREFAVAFLKLLRSFRTDHYDCIIWKTPHFDLSNPTAYDVP